MKSEKNEKNLGFSQTKTKICNIPYYDCNGRIIYYMSKDVSSYVYKSERSLLRKQRRNYQNKRIVDYSNFEVSEYEISHDTEEYSMFIKTYYDIFNIYKEIFKNDNATLFSFFIKNFSNKNTNSVLCILLECDDKTFNKLKKKFKEKIKKY